MTCILIFTQCTSNPLWQSPCINKESPLYVLTWMASFLLVVTNSHPPWSAPLGFYPFYPFLTPQLTLHYLHRRHQQSRTSSSGTVMSLLTYCAESRGKWVRDRDKWACDSEEKWYHIHLNSSKRWQGSDRETKRHYIYVNDALDAEMDADLYW
jgi:hypothetical protein